MKAFNGYAETQTYTEKMTLPPGGYVLKILNVKIETKSNGSEQLVLAFDIAEGEQAGFYQKQFNSQQGEDKKWKGTYRLWIPTDDGSEADGWAKRRFKTMTVAVEESNNGFHWDWDEQKLKGKLIGGVFNEKEWEMNGSTGFFTNLHHVVNVETIRTNDFKTPEPTYLKNRSAQAMPDGFVNVPDNAINEELPF